MLSETEQHRHGHQWVALFTAFPWCPWWACQRSSSHKNTEGQSARCGLLLPFATIPPSWFRETRSKAPTPSMNRIIAVRSKSVSVLENVGPHTHTLRASRAYWKGAVAFSAASACCFVIVLATNHLKTSLTTTPPSGFFNAIKPPIARSEGPWEALAQCQSSLQLGARC